jgi:hypothetical protein
MTPRKFFVGRAIGLLVILAIAGLVAAFYSFNNYIYQQKQGDGFVTEPYRATLAGEYACLPHVDTSGDQTDECEPGIKTDVGEYYAIDLNLMSQTPPQFSIGERFQANGVITPIERLSSDHWQKYTVEGIFSITDSVQKQ